MYDIISSIYRLWIGGLIYVSLGKFILLLSYVTKGLNEGFARWIQFLAVDQFYPEFDIWTQFVADIFAGFLRLDALKSSHPIEVPIGKFSFLFCVFFVC